MEKWSASRTALRVLPAAWVAPTACFLLHLITPGGYIGSHDLVVGVTTALVCGTHVLLARKHKVSDVEPCKSPWAL